MALAWESGVWARGAALGVRGSRGSRCRVGGPGLGSGSRVRAGRAAVGVRGPGRSGAGASRGCGVRPGSGGPTSRREQSRPLTGLPSPPALCPAGLRAPGPALECRWGPLDRVGLSSGGRSPGGRTTRWCPRGALGARDLIPRGPHRSPRVGVPTRFERELGARSLLAGPGETQTVVPSTAPPLPGWHPQATRPGPFPALGSLCCLPSCRRHPVMFSRVTQSNPK